MPDPAISLGIATLATLILAALLWPGDRGLLWRALKSLRTNERTRVEDALKHLYNCEYHSQPCTLHSLSGALRLYGAKTTDLLTRLGDGGLVRTSETGFQLTQEGRNYALRVVRVHRLWERYLSDETALPPTEWHAVADQKEHTTSDEEARRLDAHMGFPRFDPHGDPIPSASGDIAPKQGVPLTELKKGDLAEIVHIEDKPEAVYAQLVAEGVTLGMRLRLFERAPERLRFDADGEEHILAPAVAANLTVVPLPNASPTETKRDDRSLLALTEGQQARVASIASSCRGAARRRLLDLGFVPGSNVSVEMRSAGGDPTAYRVRGALIALREEQALQIRVEHANQGTPS